MSVQTLSTVGATAASFLSVDGRDLLVVSNAGSSGNREINSTVYEFTESGQLQWVRTLLLYMLQVFSISVIDSVTYNNLAGPKHPFSGSQRHSLTADSQWRVVRSDCQQRGQ